MCQLCNATQTFDPERHITDDASETVDARSSEGTLDELARYLTNGYWEDNSGPAYNFDTSEDNTITVNVNGLTSAGERLARWALEAWERIADIEFSFTSSSSADITFDDEDEDNAYASHEIGYSDGKVTHSSFVNVGKQWLTDYGSAINGYAFQTYVHEIGHALGLGHLGNYNGAASYSDGDGEFRNDSWQMSVMSYFNQEENTDTDASYANVVTPMMADIVAIQNIYGAPSEDSETAGDTTWGANTTLSDSYLDDVFSMVDVDGRSTYMENVAMALTIYDVSGTDLLDLRHNRTDDRIDMNDESFSDTNGLIGNIGIARGTVLENLKAGHGADTITGNAANNRISGGAGRDMIAGGNGADTVWGDEGNDRINGGSGNDSLVGSSGRDTVSGDNGNDILRGDAGQDSLSGGRNNDTLYGGSDDDRLYGNSGNDRLYGGTGDDDVSAGSGVDRVWGDAGDDRIKGGSGNDSLVGGSGRDTLSGENDNDILRGDAGQDSLSGGRNNDTLYGGSDDDRLYGNSGNDRIYGGTGDDYISAGSGADYVRGEGDDDVILTGSGVDRAWGGAGNDRISGGSGNDSLVGSSGADSLFGGDDNDILRGDSGQDSMEGGRHNDTLYGGSGADRLYGNSGNDRIYGGTGDDYISAGSGADYIRGEAGDDLLRGGGAADRFVFGLGDDRDEIVDFAVGEDLLWFSSQLVNGLSNAQAVLDDFASIVNGGVRFDFGDGDQIILSDLSSLDGLEDSIFIV